MKIRNPSQFQLSIILTFILLQFEQIQTLEYQCGLGCSICNSVNKCNSCFQEFMYDEQDQICIYEKCDAGLLALRDGQNNGYKCSAICKENQIANYQQSTCNPIYECSSSYTTVQFNTKISMSQLGVYKNKFILLIYSNFYNLFSIDNGLFIGSFQFKTTESKPLLINQILFSLNFSDQSVYQLDLEKGLKLILYQVVKGQLTLDSRLTVIDDDYLIVTSFDSLLFFTYINIFCYSQKQEFSQVLEIQSKSDAFQILDKNTILLLSNNNQLNLFKITKSINQFSLSQILQPDLVCSQITNLKDISYIMQISENQFMFKTQTSNFLQLFNSSSNQCGQLNQINSFKSMRKVFYQQQLIVTIQYQTKIEIYSSDLDFLASTPTLNEIKDYQFIYFELENKSQLYILDSKNNLQILLLTFTNSNFQFFQEDTIEISVVNPIGIVINNQLNTYPLVLVYNYDCEVLSSIDTKTLFILQSFQSNFPSNKSKVVSLSQTTDEKYLISTSSDGSAYVWSLNSRYRGTAQIQFDQIGETCSSSTLLQDRFVIVNCYSQFVIYDVINPYQIQSIKKTIFSASSSVTFNSQYLVINKDQCLIKYDYQFNELYRDCQSLYQSLTTIFLQEDNALIIVYGRIIKQIDIKQLQSPFPQLNLYSHDKDILIVKFRVYSDSNVKCIFSDASLNLVVLQIDLKVDTTLNISYINKIIDFSFPSNIDTEEYMILGIYNDPLANRKTRLYLLSKLYPEIKLVQTFSIVTAIVSVLYTKDSNGNEFYNVTPLIPLSYVTFIYPVIFNIHTNDYYFGQYPIVYNEAGSSDIVTKGKYATNNYMAMVSGYVGYTSIFKETYKQVHSSTPDQPIQKVYQSLRLERYFIFSYNIAVHNIHSDEAEETLTFNDQANFVKDFVLNYKLKIILFFKEKEIVMKNYSTNQPYRNSQTNSIFGAFISDQINKIIVIGRGFQIFSLNLQQQQILFPDSDIKQCIFTISRYICKQDSFNIVIINPLTMDIILTFTASNIPSTFTISFDEAQQRIFVYDKLLQYYDVNGNFKGQISDSTQPIKELNQYGDKIVSIYIGGGFIYDRVTMSYLSQFYTPQAGILQKTVYIPLKNMMVYFTDQIRYGQVQFYSLKTLNDIGIFTSQTWANIGQAISITLDPYMNELIVFDELGNLGNIQYLSNISADNAHTLEFLFRTNKPIDIDVSFLTNSILTANIQNVFRLNYACLTNQHQRYFRKLAQYSIELNFNSALYYLIIDATNIIYKYNNFQLVYVTKFKEKVIDIQVVDLNNQLVAIMFAQKIIIFSPSLTQGESIQLNQQFTITKYYYRQYLCQNSFFTYDQKLIEYDFVNNKELFNYQFSTKQDLINTYTCISSEQKIIIGFFTGQVVIYNRQIKQIKEITNSALAIDQIQNIIYSNQCIYAFQRSGNILFLYEDASKPPSMVLQSNYISLKSNIELSEAIFDKLYSRLYLTFQDQHILFIFDINNLTLVKYLSYSNDEYNRIYIGDNLLVLYSTFQLNIYTRDTMEFIQSIIKVNKQETIDSIFLTQDIYLIITLTTKVEVYLLDIDNFSFTLIDTIVTSFPKILHYSIKINQSNQPLLWIVGFSSDIVFERFYSINLFLSGSQQCSSKFTSQRSLDTQLQFKTVYKPDSKIQYSLFFEIGDSLEVFNQIEISQIQLIINPIINNKVPNQNDCLNQLNLYKNSFLSLKNDIMIKCFSFIFNEKGLYNFNEENSKVIFENIRIVNQNLSDVKILLQNQKSIVFQNIKIDKINTSPYSDQTQFKDQQYIILIENCDYLNIYNLTITNIDQQESYPIFLIRNVKQVLIKNSTLKNSVFSKIFRFEAVQKLQILDFEVSENNGFFRENPSFTISYLIEIDGSREIEFKDVNVIQNNNINLLISSNTQQLDDMVIILSTDSINFKDVSVKLNNFTQQFLSVNGELSTMFSLSNSIINLNNFVFEENQSNISIISSKQAFINYSSFKSSSGKNGGALSGSNIELILSIQNTKFISNSAQGSGGAIYLQNVKKLQIGDQTVIQYNKSLIGGGIRYIFSQEVSESYLDTNYQISDKAIISNNIAQIYGNNIDSYPSKIKLHIQTETQIFESLILESRQFSKRNLQYFALQLNSIQSGGFMSIALQFYDIEDQPVKISLDNFNNQVYPKSIRDDLEQMHYSILPTFKDSNLIQLSDQSLVSIHQYDSNKQGLVKQDLQISGLPSTSNQINIHYQTNSGEVTKIFSVGIEFRNCITGEVFKFVTKDIIQCQSCLFGFYSLVEVSQLSEDIQNLMKTNKQLIDNILCKKCPDSALKCQKSEINLKNGYWRESNKSEEIFQCINNLDSCIPEDDSNKQGCAEGYIGPLCDFCDTEGVLWNNRYTESVRRYHCSQCSIFSAQLVYIILILIFILLYIIIQVIMFMNSYIHFQLCYYLRLTRILPISVSALRDQSSFYMKILINFLQISSIILHIKFKLFPKIIVVGPSVFGNAVGNVSIDINCVYPKEFITQFGTGRLRQITQTFLPPIFLIFLILIFAIMEKYKQQQVGKYHKYTLLSFLIMFFQPDSLNLYAKSLTCRQIGSLRFFTYDSLFQCNDEGYNNFLNYFTIPNLIFWIIFPLFPLYQLYKKRKNLNWCSVKLKYGYFYTEFKPQFYYWEFIRIYVKVLIVLLYTFLAQNTRINIILINFIITIYIIAVIHFKPFQRISLKKIEISSFLTIIILCVLQGLNEEIKNISFELFYVFFNYLFILYIIYIIIYEKIASPFNYLGKCIRFCLHKIFSKELFEKFSVQRRTSMNCYLKWKKIKNNLSILTQMKAINTIDLKKISNQEQKGNGSQSLHQQSFHSLQEKLKTNISSIIQYPQPGIQEYFTKTPEFKLAINNLKKKNVSPYQKTLQNSIKKSSDQINQVSNSQIQLMNHQQLNQQCSQTYDVLSLSQQGSPPLKSQQHNQLNQIDKISDISSETNDDFDQQFQEMSSYYTPKAVVAVNKYQIQSEKIWNTHVKK